MPEYCFHKQSLQVNGNHLESCFTTMHTEIYSAALATVSAYANIITIESAYLLHVLTTCFC
jgi:hypothetical protein